MNSSMEKVSIPQEIIFEIFSWLPAKSLMRFKCVSRSYNFLVFNSDFVDIHNCRSMTRPSGTKYLMQRAGVYYVAEQKKYVKGIASLLQIEKFNRFNELYHRAPTRSCLSWVNGLFCFWKPLSERSAVILNPSTRKVRFLPEFNEDLPPSRYSLGFEPKEKKYKVVSTICHVQEGYIKYWIFTLGIDKSWRDTQTISHYFPRFMPSICISGIIYQLVMCYSKFTIVAFDVRSENSELIALWNTSELVYNYEMIEVKGKLAMIDYGRWLSGYINLWILEQTPRKEWERHIISVPFLWNDIEPKFVSSCMARDGEIVFVLNIKSGALCCLCYDVTRKSWKELKIKGLPKVNCYIKGIYSYFESLVPLV